MTSPTANAPAAAPTADELAAAASDTPVFSPEEEASLLADANQQKTHANSLFTTGAYTDAISAYGRALASCPNYLDYEVAVLRANIAACHLKLEEWKDAVDAATTCLERLEGLDPVGEQNENNGKSKSLASANGKGEGKGPGDGAENGSRVIEEVSGSEDEADQKAAGQRAGSSGGSDKVTEAGEEMERRLSHLHRLNHSITEVRKLRAKALLRRAKARAEQGGWANLQGADEDYRAVAATPGLSALDKKQVDAALRDLPGKLEEAKQKEVGEMMGKLKSLGNGLLKPFGLSTDNFAFVKDEKTGGYSVQMK
ncbi:hypothetical protein B0J12DRAFT_784454 [Macrophomina phaseolina]|uniref:Tetratricopeptide repeat protein 1 n=1 Tax=Macrophomina phaseolina TaxID=35725 RepID=A0ABQ8GFJ4_9PEZI|nr:hypothetical protein B0J12DRAFT_784454 [Macrophomina phaseolina]